MPHRECVSRSIRRAAGFCGALLATVLLAGLTAGRGVSHAQPGDAIDDVDADQEDAAEGADDERRSATETAGDRLFPGAARLNVDFERERLMARAERYAAAGQIEPALLRWQQMLDEPRTRIHSGGVALHEASVVRTSVGQSVYGRYFALGHEIERLIARSSPAVLDAYQEMSDPAARAVLNDQRRDRREALGRIVHSYFLSSFGDDAAYELAAVRFDRGEMPAAARLLTRILEDHPRPDVPREKVLFRLALVEARMGHVATARKRMEELSRLPVAEVSPELRRLARREIETAAERAARSVAFPSGPAPASSQVSVPLPAPPSRLFEVPLTEEWVAPRAPRSGGVISRVETRVVSTVRANALGIRQAVQSQTDTTDPTPDETAASWRRHGWTPAAALLIDGGRAYLAGDVDLICIDLATGRPLWRSDREYHYEATLLAQQFSQQASGDGLRPQSTGEARLFGDRVHQAMSLGAGGIHVLEGLLADKGTRPGDIDGAAPISISQRVRHNWLTRYDARTGKLKWTRQAADEEIAKDDTSFLAAPAAAGGRLFVPVSDRGAVWLHALDAERGETLWRTFLCDEPLGSASPWSPVAVVCAGSDVYVCPGTGVVFALDAASGDVHWAVRYQRSGRFDQRPTHRGIVADQVREFEGWNEDALIPHEGRLIVLASDYDRLFALDRRSGDLMWESPRAGRPDDPQPAWCLGLLDGGLYVAGPGVVRRYEAAGGRLVWQRSVERATGRGFVSPGGVYLPLDETIVRLDAETGEPTHRTRFVSPSPEPLGNLYSDGERLLVAGPRRLCSLVGLEQRLRSLAGRIERRDPHAHLERMRLRRKLGESDAALDDLKSGWRLLADQEGFAAGSAALHAGIDDLELATTRPDVTLELLHEAAEFADRGGAPTAEPSTNRAEFDRDAAGVALRALNAIERDRPAVVPAILDAASLYATEHLAVAAQRAIAAAAIPADGPALLEALAGDDRFRRRIAVAGLSAALGEEARVRFALLIDDPQDEVRLAAAIGLGTRGDRAALRPLVELLGSEELPIRARSIEALRGLTGRHSAFMAYESSDRRRVAQRDWEEWLIEHGDTAELRHPFGVSGPRLGRTLIAFLNINTVLELDAQGEEVWTQPATNPFGCEGLPNGHRLVTSYSMRTVTEYDADGREVWKLADLPASPYNAHRLPNGNTLVACSNSGQVLEFDPAKKEVWKAAFPSARPTDAHRLPNGNTLVVLQLKNAVVEVDQSGETVWTLEQAGRPIAVHPLENGNLLVCLSHHVREPARVVEWDRAEKEVWRFDAVQQPFNAQRLPNGNTLIADQQGVREVTPGGEIVWKRLGVPASSVHRY
ncbi:MAG: PQQ-binding-like beta-propeller repeat protein [Planctomycetaceae bacterium]